MTTEKNYSIIKEIIAYYHFQKNAFGDVVRILGWDGFPIAEYVYDAWGNHKVLELNGVEIVDSSHIANVNPFRYRGYYFDTETGFYYLESRYYNPKTCRFVTPDDLGVVLENLSTTINGLNIYTYCNNNPVGIINDGNLISSEKVSFVKHNIDREKISIERKNFHASFKANSVMFNHYTISLIKDPLVAWAFGNVSCTITTQLNSANMFYSFSNVGNAGKSVGVGINFLNRFGASVYASSDFGIGANFQFTPWVVGGFGWS